MKVGNAYFIGIFYLVFTGVGALLHFAGGTSFLQLETGHVLFLIILAATIQNLLALEAFSSFFSEKSRHSTEMQICVGCISGILCVMINLIVLRVLDANANVRASVSFPLFLFVFFASPYLIPM